MTIEEDYQAELRKVAESQCTYVAPELTDTIEDQIASVDTEIYNLVHELTPRPSEYLEYTGKQAYIAYLSHLESDRASLVTQNNQIIADNSALIATATAQYEYDITTAMADDTNKWTAIRTLRDSLLRQIYWVQLGDIKLSAQVKQDVKDYRELLQDFSTTYANPDDIVWPTPPTIPPL